MILPKNHENGEKCGCYHCRRSRRFKAIVEKHRKASTLQAVTCDVSDIQGVPSIEVER